MKKIAAFLIAVIMLFGCVACQKEPDPDTLNRIQVAYSVKNVDSGDFIVEIQEILANAEPYKSLYGTDGTVYIEMSKKAKIYDAKGNEIKKSDLIVGDTLEIYYDGTVEHNNPKTIKAYKIVKIV